MIKQELLKALITLLTGLAIAWVGLKIYFRQKEYELVKQRYLEQAIDVVATELEVALDTFTHNWARCLQLLKEYRDMEDNFDSEQLSKGFLEYESAKFQRIAHHRLRSLTNSDLFWHSYQLAISFAASANSMAVSEIPNAIKARLKGSSYALHSDIVEAGLSKMMKLNEESHQFAHLFSALQALATELERERFNFKSINTFHKRKAVVNAVEKLSSVFSKDISSQVE